MSREVGTKRSLQGILQLPGKRQGKPLPVGLCSGDLTLVVQRDQGPDLRSGPILPPSLRLRVYVVGGGGDSPRIQTVIRHQQDVLQLISILTPPTRRQCQIPQMKGSVPHLQMPFACLDCHLAFSNPQARRFLQPLPWLPLICWSGSTLRNG